MTNRFEDMLKSDFTDLLNYDFTELLNYDFSYLEKSLDELRKHLKEQEQD